MRQPRETIRTVGVQVINPSPYTDLNGDPCQASQEVRAADFCACDPARQEGRVAFGHEDYGGNTPALGAFERARFDGQFVTALIACLLEETAFLVWLSVGQEDGS